MADIAAQWRTVIRRIAVSMGGRTPLSGVEVLDEFYRLRSGDGDPAAILNAAFLTALAAPTRAFQTEATAVLDRWIADPSWGNTASFYREGLRRLPEEMDAACRTDSGFRRALEQAAQSCGMDSSLAESQVLPDVWRVFFPEGAWCLGDPQGRAAAVRDKRRIRVGHLNPDPIRRPAREVLFTSNVLLTLPDPSTPVDSLPYSANLRRRLKAVMAEPQRYYFDHPIQIGVETEVNEAVYGLRGLDRAMAFEKVRGTMGPEERLRIVLSVSVTHEGLRNIAMDYLREVFDAANPLPHLEVFVFSEAETARILESVLLPAIRRYGGADAEGSLARVFGVDGAYGRHFSFLKAVSALWQVLVDPEVKGVYKMDLDQVFPQEELVAETGRSALEHFTTPLWGASGVDRDGRPVELGMLAGALVNREDISGGLFTPDVPLPKGVPGGEGTVFFSPLPMALSTRGEMMTRYGAPPLDGRTGCIERVHVTGGTTGIRIRSLRKHRPFTPTWFGRAEDQAYLPGSLFRGGERDLRYVHAAGLVMRHDKTQIAVSASERAKAGKYVGDLERILNFSTYLPALNLPWAEAKDFLGPFTGCFASRTPFTLAYLRASLHISSLFAQGDAAKALEAGDIQRLAAIRLEEQMGKLEANPRSVRRSVEAETRGWHLYYDTLDRLAEGLRLGDGVATELRARARKVVRRARLFLRGA
jgi:hypothetical protein